MTSLITIFLMSNKITVETTAHADLKKVWDYWTIPEHVMRWNAASEDWECPAVKNDLVEGGKFVYTMRAKDGSASFDFSGTYTRIQEGRLIEYVIDDGREVSVLFEEIESGVHITEIFEAETEHPEEMQRTGWQSILDRFKVYTE